MFRSSLRILAVVLVLGVVAFAVFYFFRGGSFDADDVVVAIVSADEFDVGSEQDVRVSIANSTSAILRDGLVTLDVGEGLEVIETADANFDTIASREQHTARFRLKVKGEAGETPEITARVRFHPRQLSAVFTKEARKTLRLRDLPLDVSFSFPSDASNTRPMTFFVRVSSRASDALGPVGLVLETPETFSVSRTRPETSESEKLLWDFGTFTGGDREEISVTGSFDSSSDGGEFIAHVGILDASRRQLSASRETREFLNLRAGAMKLDLLVGGYENPKETVIYPGDTIAFTIRYQNQSGATIEDLTMSLAFAHPAIDQLSIQSSERFTRSVTGEYVFGPSEVYAFQKVLPNASGTITFSARLGTNIPIRSFEEANQRIVARARAISGGQLLGERETLFKIGGVLDLAAEVLYYDAPGGTNHGPLPPKVGEETTYTATLTVTTGTNGMEGVVVRAVLGPHVRYDTLIEPEGVEVDYNETTHELVWTIGAIPPAAGKLSPPKTLSFRLALRPTESDVGTTPDLLSEITATGVDTYTILTLDARAPAVDTNVPDDTKVAVTQKIVVP